MFFFHSEVVSFYGKGRMSRNLLRNFDSDPFEELMSRIIIVESHCPNTRV
jgi:hypothetical protein